MLLWWRWRKKSRKQLIANFAPSRFDLEKLYIPKSWTTVHSNQNIKINLKFLYIWLENVSNYTFHMVNVNRTKINNTFKNDLKIVSKHALKVLFDARKVLWIFPVVNLRTSFYLWHCWPKNLLVIFKFLGFSSRISKARL